jgi:hypothetical protein
MKRALSGLFLALLTATSSAADRVVNPEDIEMALASPDPRTALATYWNCSRPRGTVCSAIETGEPKWIDLAERMLAYSDAGVTEDLLGSLGRAMQIKPEHVLPLVGKSDRLDPAHLCVPFISNELPVHRQLAELRRSKRAIARVRGLAPQKQACLSFIDKQLKAPHAQVQ